VKDIEHKLEHKYLNHTSRSSKYLEMKTMKGSEKSDDSEYSDSEEYENAFSVENAFQDDIGFQDNPDYPLTSINDVWK
jgi:hypothetical protein